MNKGLCAQNFTLKLYSKKEKELLVLDKIDYQKKHNDTITLKLEVNRISNYLKNVGYFTNTLDSISIKDRIYTANYSLNNKIDFITIKIDSNFLYLFNDYQIKNNKISLPINNLKNTLSEISSKLDKKGKSFSKVQLKNILIKNKFLYADLEINESKKRIINKVIIKGYKNFPKSFLKNYFKINSNTVFNQQKIKEISNYSKGLTFVSEIKPPEVLFTKDSTLLYMYLRKQENNSFDGIVNFTSKEDGGVLFNGNIDLKLNNILNTGEKFELFWNSIGDERQEFKLSTEIPYVFNSKISPEFSFSIYKQDSTFLNTKFDSKLFYNINPKSKLALTYNSEFSENLEDNLNNNIESFSNFFIGFKYQYNIPKNDFFFNNKFNLEINPTFGKRKIDQNSSNQFKIDASISYLWDLNLRNSIFLKNRTAILSSDNYIDNELFRIGGVNSLRGFNEQSIFTNNYTYFNLEYRYLTSESSYFYSITDIGTAIVNLETNDFLGIGLGYKFTTKKSLINLGLVLNKQNNQSFSFTDSTIIINWTSIF